MKRGYTVAEYREMLQRIRETVPGAAGTSDFIVGFCGETEDDFAATVRLVEESRFKNSFIFKYSPREGAKSFDLYPDDVPEDVKKRRNNELLAIQNRISEEDNQPFVGRQVEILVEGPSKKAAAPAAPAASIPGCRRRRRGGFPRTFATGKSPHRKSSTLRFRSWASHATRGAVRAETITTTIPTTTIITTTSIRTSSRGDHHRHARPRRPAGRRAGRKRCDGDNMPRIRTTTRPISYTGRADPAIGSWSSRGRGVRSAA